MNLDSDFPSETPDIEEYQNFEYHDHNYQNQNHQDHDHHDLDKQTRL